MLKPGESFDSLEYKGLGIIQRAELYRFTSDAVALANYVKARPTDRVLDLGSGSGIIGTLIAAKRGASVVGVEIQAELCDMAERSAQINGLLEKLEFLNMRVQDARDASADVGKPLPRGGFDAIVSNPPYGKRADAAGISNMSEAIARAECEITLGEIVAAAAFFLRFGGRFYTVIKMRRLAEILSLMTANKIEPKELILIINAPDKPPDTALICGIRGGKTGMKTSLRYNF
ncbi:MAG: methyltransferase [Clostridiales bacterium]|jgi:tRNA1(Val) A37 N6-methylase TrmN6|nr:methyltransferase [Clostridiales bacterium]